MLSLALENKEGSIENTLSFLKHIFGGHATATENMRGDPFTIALDWLTIFHKDPNIYYPFLYW